MQEAAGRDFSVAPGSFAENLACFSECNPVETHQVLSLRRLLCHVCSVWEGGGWLAGG
jgi:hypothetical protein